MLSVAWRPVAAILSCAVALGGALAPSMVLAADPPAAAPPRISAEAFAKHTSFRQPELSPDGISIMGRYTVAGKEQLVVMSLAGTDMQVIPIPDDNNLDYFEWAGNRKVIFGLARRMPFGDINEATVRRAFIFDLDSGKAVKVQPSTARAGQSNDGMAINGANIIWIAKDGSSALLVSSESIYKWPGVYRVDLTSGKARLEQTPYENIYRWFADLEGNVRLGIGRLPNGWFTLYRSKGSGGYDRSEPKTYSNMEGTLGVLTIPVGSDKGYVISEREGRKSKLYPYDFRSGEYGEPMFQDIAGEIGNAVQDRCNADLVGLPFYQDDDTITVWLAPDMKQAADKLSKTFRNRKVEVGSWTCDRSRMVINVRGPREPGVQYIYDAGTGSLAKLGRVADTIDRAGVSETRYVTYKARDGLDIGAYLTLPVGREARNLPLVIMPHGGPYGIRDSMEYDAWVQFLANRGYAVFQPNYRGSGGYGVAFEQAGEGEWGRKMQDDLDDGMDWLVKQGTVDARRVCIIGSSYGGYAAMWGATRNPERYRCAVSHAGISDLDRQLQSQRDIFTGKRASKQWVDKVQGDPNFRLGDVSPINNIAKMRIPILLAHGDDDTRVPFVQSEVYAIALQKAGKTVEFYRYKDEPHGFLKEANEQDFLEKVEAFLTKYNPS